jgi:hypothetical protein
MGRERSEEVTSLAPPAHWSFLGDFGTLIAKHFFPLRGKILFPSASILNRLKMVTKFSSSGSKLGVVVLAFEFIAKLHKLAAPLGWQIKLAPNFC